MTTTHTYDALVIGGGRRGHARRDRAVRPGQDRGDLQALPDPLAHRRGAGRRVRGARATPRRTRPEWHAFDTVKGGDYLTDQPAAQLMAEEAIEAIYQLERWGLPFNRTPDGRIDQRRFGGHTANHGERPVRRACYAADRTGHMILQTLYQQCVKRDVRFFNEFYCLDLLRADDGSAAGRRRVRARDGRAPRLPREVDRVRDRRLRPDVPRHVQRPRADRRRPRARVAPRHPARGHGDVPVPPDGPGPPGRAAVGGRARRGRGRAQQGRRALHGALRPDDQGPRAARHGEPRDLPGDQGGARRRSQRRLGLPRHLPPRPRDRSRRSCPTSPSSPAST